jgi:hypothetical protein
MRCKNTKKLNIRATQLKIFFTVAQFENIRTFAPYFIESIWIIKI